MTASAPGWVWLNRQVMWAVHEEHLVEHGGAGGVRDAGGLESNLSPPLKLAACAEPDAPALAAAYGCGLATNHPFVDGNRGTAFVAVELFLALNGWKLRADDADCVLTMLALAAGDVSQTEFTDWLRRHAQPLHS